jgi:hypothetical protein
MALAFQARTESSNVKALGFSAPTGGHDSLTRQLARFVLNTRFEDLPKPIVES